MKAKEPHCKNENIDTERNILNFKCLWNTYRELLKT